MPRQRGRAARLLAVWLVIAPTPLVAQDRPDGGRPDGVAAGAASRGATDATASCPAEAEAPPDTRPAALPARKPVSSEDERATKRAERGLTPFAASPFPYDGAIPGRNVPFMDRDADGAFHDSPRGGRLREAVYADSRSFIFVPPRFDPKREDAALILYFHGNCALLARDVAVRQRVPQQLAASRLNAVLVAPQLARDALDSSAGHFWNDGFLDRYLDEAARHLAERSRRRFTAAEIDRLPVVIVAYSGGYLPAAFSLLHAAKGRHRIEGVVLLDALFGEDDKFARWIESPTASPFFVSLYSKSSGDNNAAMVERLRAHKLAVEDELPEHIGPGTIAFVAHLDSSHDDFVTDAGTGDPLADVLRRIAPPRPVADAAGRMAGKTAANTAAKTAARRRASRGAVAGTEPEAAAEEPR